MNLNKLPVVIRDQIPHARLPVNYEAAKIAIIECAKVDECKEWVDKAAAIATYAKQACDNSLKDAAIRIQLRAESRLGELLLEYDEQRKKSKERLPTKSEFARDNGVSYALERVVIPMARVPRETRDELIEATPPVKRAELSQLGITPKPDSFFIERRRREEQGRVNYYKIHFNEVVKFIKWTKDNDARESAQEVPHKELQWVKDQLPKLLDWLDEFEQHLPKTVKKR